MARTSQTRSADRPNPVYLIGLVEVWTPADKMKPMGEAVEGSLVRLAEFESIEIRSSYQNVIDTATVSFPRGTLIRRTLEAVEPEDMATVVKAGTDANGVLMENREDRFGRSTSQAAAVTDFKVGNRIRIRLGYTTDHRVFRMTKVSDGRKNIFNDNVTYNEYVSNLKIMFEGYVTRCSVETPITIECENLGHLLKCITCKKITTTDSTTVMQLLNGKDNGGVYGLLAGTAVPLKSGFDKSQDIVIGKETITPDLTVLDVLNQWHKWKVYPFVIIDGDGKPALDVKRTYVSSTSDQEPDSILYGKTVVRPTVEFDWHVASNGLTLFDTDKNFLAVKASSREKDDKGIVTLTIVPNPDADVDEDNKRIRFRVVNEKKVSKKAMKKHHVRMVSEGSSKVNLSDYTVVEFFSKKIGLTHDQLLDEAVKYWDSYNKNGIDGSLTLFGDLMLGTGDVIRIHDPRSTQKDGVYLVESVVTSFGVNGFRQTVTLPYCISRDADRKE